MEFKIGQRVKVVRYPDDVGVVGRTGTVTDGSKTYIDVALHDASGLDGVAYEGHMLFAKTELEDASCCGNQHELCDECPLDEPTDGCPCVGDPPCEDCPAKVPPGVEVADFIAGREGKPRNGSEAVMLDPRSGDTGIFARPSTAPNADRIAALEDKVQEQTDALADAMSLIQTLAASISMLWLDTYES